MAKRSWFRFEVITSVLLMAIVALDGVNGRLWMNDFRVYWEAGGRLLHGEAVYGVAAGLSSGFFKYSPFAALVLAPLSALPYAVASLLFALCIVAASIAVIRLCERLLRGLVVLPGPSFRTAVLWWTFLVVAVHLHRELHLGNINMLLLLALLVALQLLVGARDVAAGVLIGIVLLFKPHFIVLMALLPLHGRYRAVLVAGVTLLVGFLLPAAVVGWSANIGLLRDWAMAMATHNASVFYLGGDDKEPMNTIYTALHRMSGGAIPTTRTMALVILGGIAGAMFVFDRWLAKRDRGDVAARSRDLLFEALLLIALVPSITVTDTEHFLLATPMVMFLVFQLMRSPRPSWSLAAGIALLWLFGGNWGDLLGAFSDVLLDNSALGIANLALVICCAILFARERNTRIPA